ncbi:MAG: hypothetical protein KGI08_09975, partial [Thaumarchaeota archaeon]|nr:hypothetical protein [Nitrososphaerota archaeon]
MERNEHIIFNNEGKRFEQQPSGLYTPDKKVVLPPRDEAGRFTKLQQVREKLASIQPIQPDTTTHDEQVVQLPSLPAVQGGDTPGGILEEKEMKRKIRRIKEQSPKFFEERLLVVNDQQLLKSCDDEALGAFIKYGEDTGKTVTHYVINGDLTDNERASVFPKMPTSGEDVTGDEIEATRWFLKKSEEMFPNAQLVLIMGNHDKERYL